MVFNKIRLNSAGHTKCNYFDAKIDFSDNSSHNRLEGIASKIFGIFNQQGTQLKFDRCDVSEMLQGELEKERLWIFDIWQTKWP